ncbi:MAG: DUF4097 family beta strand repeat-containing protein [Candidatus Acidiferrales bacterium]
MSNGTHQRQSVFGGLILILIGVLFLLHHFRPELGIAHLFRVYWPLLLIVWGIAKLIENFSPRNPADPRRPVVTGSEIALLILLIFLALGLDGYDRVRTQFPSLDIGDIWTNKGVAVAEELPAQKIPPNSTISINTDEGDITVFAEDSDELRVVATKTVTALSDQESRKRGEEITLQIAPMGTTGYEVRPSGTSGRGHARVDFEVHVPKQATIIAKTEKGDINVGGVSGTVTATTHHGDVEVHDTGGVTIEMQSGDVRAANIKGDVSVKGPGNDVSVSDVSGDATFDGDFYGSVQLEKIAQTTRFTSSRTTLTILNLRGHLDLDSGGLQVSDVRGNIRVATRDRDVNLENTAGRFEISDAHGDVSVNLNQPPKDEINITNDTGGVELAIPAASTFEITAASRSGDIQSDFGASGLNQQTSEDSSSLNGKVGTRGPKITIATSYGTINLRKSES